MITETEKEYPKFGFYLSCIRPKHMIPDLELESIAKLDILNHLMIHDIKGVILDVDNTLTSYHKDVFYNQAIEFKVDKIKDKFKKAKVPNLEE